MSSFVRRLVIGVLSLIGLVLLSITGLAVCGWFLPVEHRVARTVVLAQPLDAVWKTVADHAGETAWRPELRAIERLPDQGGRPAWAETHASGRRLVLVEVEREPPRRLVREALAEDGAPSGRWTLALAPDGTGTRVTLTESGRFDNPVRRSAARLVGRTRAVDAWLRALGRRFAQGVEPLDAPDAPKG